MKVGILTHYYKSNNYGGVLQSYALVKFLRKNNLDAEQICYEYDERSFEEQKGLNVNKNADSKKQIETPDSKNSFLSDMVYRVKNFKQIVRLKKYQNYTKKYEKNQLAKRHARFNDFRNLINHSQAVFNAENIETADGYDCFIAGSDQVWNFQWFNLAFFLDFNTDKKKIAYAASAGKSVFAQYEKEYINKTLPSFNAISVREKDLADILKEMNCFNNPIKHVVDPVFLLNSAEWDEICSDRLVQEKYVFCYSLGNDVRLKNLTKIFAKKHNLKVVNIPFVCGFNRYDIKFADRKMHYAAPQDFVSLVKHAEYIFTDSFHATAFSFIYHKECFVLPRCGEAEMSSRIYSVTELFNSTEHFCDTANRQTIEYIENLKPIDYSDTFEKYEALRKESESFLIQNILS